MTNEFDSVSMERKWQERWLKSEIWKAELKPGAPKFFMIFAYPGVSGYLHVGHMRGYTYTDVVTRYKRMKGFNVLFPVGAHPTGNISISFARRVERGDQAALEYLRHNGCPEEEIQKLKDPKEVVRYFSEVYINEYWKRFGFLVDWRRFMRTIDPGYKKFIQWQFRKLHQLGLLTQKPYFGAACLKCGPVAVDASETDISVGGNAEKQEWTLLKFKLGSDFVMAATLRPETVFGQTNFWADPNVTYVRARVGNENWLVSREAAEKLAYQKDSVQVIGEVLGKDLVGRKVIAPVINREIPILPSKFCDPNFGTGMVTSVPSDAPFDWIALHDLMEDPETCKKYGLAYDEIKAMKLIPIIVSKGWGELPAVEICEKMGIKNQEDPRLEEATKEIYKAGFHTGKMNQNCGEFEGMPVSEAKDKVKEMMLEKGLADVMYDLSERVLCRCGERVIIKKIPDQWFINYGDKNLTDESKQWAGKMNILPEEYKRNMQGILDWFQERACVRQGNWLGTQFPLDEKWIIEPISDSTLYPAYYTISHLVEAGKIKPEQMTEKFFDYVFLGRGTEPDVVKESGIPKKALEEAKKEFDYWYPLDINLGGKEHMTVHFPVFLMNHVAIMPQRCWPQGILVNWYIVMAGGKVSKSKGGAQPIPNAAARFTVDGMRLYYSHVASPFADVEWSEAAVQHYKFRLDKVREFVSEISALKEKKESQMDKWLESRMHSHVKNIELAMEKFELRDAANIVYYDMLADLKWYLRRGGANKKLLDKTIKCWLRTMAPFTPHLAEEMWESTGHKGFVSIAEFPKPEEFKPDMEAENSERYLLDIKEDIGQILKVTGITPKRACVFVAPEWKQKLFALGMEMLKTGKVEMNALMKQAMAIPDMKQHSKEVANFTQKFVKEANKYTETDKNRFSTKLDELKYLQSAKQFLGEEIGCQVEIFMSDDKNKYDPKNRAGQAHPYRPALYVE